LVLAAQAVQVHLHRAQVVQVLCFQQLLQQAVAVVVLFPALMQVVVVQAVELVILFGQQDLETHQQQFRLKEITAV
jgi:hypothetical protein